MLGFLAERNGWLDGIVITGGEPTIHKDLPSFIRKIREMNYKIKLDTNGSNPIMIREMLNEKLIDCIAIDVKTILKEEEYIKITGCNDPKLLNYVVETIKIVKDSDIEKIFRTTVLPSHHNNDIVNFLRSEFKDENYILQPFREGITLSDFLNRETLQSDNP